MSTVDLPNIREPFIDTRSGQISRPWWIWLQQLMSRIGGSDGTDLTVIIELINQARAAIVTLERLAQSADQPLALEAAELAAQVAAALEALNLSHGLWEDPDLHALVTTSQHGFMSSTDKGILDGLAANSVPNTRQVIAGAGLTGGGALSADVTLDVVANADGSIVVGANDVRVGVLATDAQHGNRGGGALHANATTATAGFMSGADKTKVDELGRGFSARQGTAQSFSASTFAKVTYETELFDDDLAYNPATATYTVPVTGRYTFTATIQGTQGVNANRALDLYVNGSAAFRLGQNPQAPGYGTIGGNSGILNLTAGDTVTVEHFTSVADTSEVSVGIFNRFSGWRVK